MYPVTQNQESMNETHKRRWIKNVSATSTHMTQMTILTKWKTSATKENFNKKMVAERDIEREGEEREKVQKKWKANYQRWQRPKEENHQTFKK